MLDTNALIWLMEGSSNLGTIASDLAEAAKMESTLYVSAMSFWEVGLLIVKNRLELDRPMTIWRDVVLEQGIEEIPLTGGMAMRSTTLVGLPNDPADRIIVATAMTVGGVLVTDDGRLLRWDGALERHDARA